MCAALRSTSVRDRKYEALLEYTLNPKPETLNIGWHGRGHARVISKICDLIIFRVRPKTVSFTSFSDMKRTALAMLFIPIFIRALNSHS